MEEYENQMELERLNDTVNLIKRAITDLPENHDDVSDEKAKHLLEFFNKLVHEIFPGLN